MLGFTAYSETPFAQATTASLANAFIASATATAYIEALGYDAKAYTSISSVNAYTEINEVETDAKAVVDYGSVSATASLEDFANVSAKAVYDLGSVVTNSSVNDVTVTAQAVQSFDSVSAELGEPSLDIQAQAAITTGSVFATTYYEDLADIIAEANTLLSSLELDTTVNKPTYTLDNFDYKALAADYSRERTLYLISYSNPENVVYVKPENNTVVIQKMSGSNTVHITA